MKVGVVGDFGEVDCVLLVPKLKGVTHTGTVTVTTISHIVISYRRRGLTYEARNSPDCCAMTTAAMTPGTINNRDLDIGAIVSSAIRLGRESTTCAEEKQARSGVTGRPAALVRNNRHLHS